MILVPAVTLRMRILPVSAMSIFPLLSIATPSGPLKLASSPATVVMKLLLAATRRMRLFPVSAISRFPPLSTATPRGANKLASIAGPPSPLKRSIPSPATVVIILVFAATLRMRLLAVSAMNRFPLGSTATPHGLLKFAYIAFPPSPPKPGMLTPATVLMRLVTASIRRIR